MKNAARTGGGIGLFAPFTDFQMISLKIRSSAWSSFSRLSFSEIAAPKAVEAFTSLRFTFGTTCLYGVRSGFAVNELYIGRAAASNWLIGLRPRISSIVRNMLVVL